MITPYPTFIQKVIFHFLSVKKIILSILIFSNITEGLEICSKFIDSIYNCEYIVKRLFYNGKNDQHCLDDCPRECEYVEYETTVYNSKFPSEGEYLLFELILFEPKSNLLILLFFKGYKGFLKTRLDNEKSFQNSSDGIVAINVFYRDSKLNKKEEEPALTNSIFISQLGGALGFFLGCSILSFIEIVEAFIRLIMTLIEKHK